MRAVGGRLRSLGDGGLSIGFNKGAAEGGGAGEDDLEDNTMSLTTLVSENKSMEG